MSKLNNMKSTIADVLEQEFGVEFGIDWNATLSEHGLDSLDSVEFIMEVEVRLGTDINIDQDKAGNIKLEELAQLILDNI